jgi:hypothetical protein
MSEAADKTVDLVDLTQPGSEAKDPEYLAWVEGKIEHGQRDLRNPSKRHGESEVWKEHGLED